MPWLIRRADSTVSPSSVQEFLRSEDFAQAWKDAPGMNYEGVNMNRHPTLINLNKVFQTDNKFRKCDTCGKVLRDSKSRCEKCALNHPQKNMVKTDKAIVKDKNKDSNKKMIENAPTAGKQNSNTYYNSGADDEIKGNSTYDAYKNYLITVKPDGQEGAYTHTTHSD